MSNPTEVQREWEEGDGSPVLARIQIDLGSPTANAATPAITLYLEIEEDG